MALFVIYTQSLMAVVFIYTRNSPNMQRPVFAIRGGKFRIPARRHRGRIARIKPRGDKVFRQACDACRTT